MSPALPNVPGCIKSTISYQPGPGPVAQSILHWDYSGSPPNQAAIDAFGTAMFAAAQGHLVGLFQSATALETITLLDLSSGTGVGGVYGSATAGTRVGTQLPAQVATLVNFRVAQHYRGGKPRMYAPWGNVADLQNDDTWNTSYVNAVTSAWSAFLVAVSGFTSGGMTVNKQCAVSYYKGYNPPVTHPGGRVTQSPALNPAGPSKYDITSFSVNPRISTQRRRLGR